MLQRWLNQSMCMALSFRFLLAFAFICGNALRCTELVWEDRQAIYCAVVLHRLSAVYPADPVGFFHYTCAAGFRMRWSTSYSFRYIPFLYCMWKSVTETGWMCSLKKNHVSHKSFYFSPHLYGCWYANIVSSPLPVFLEINIRFSYTEMIRRVTAVTFLRGQIWKEILEQAGFKQPLRQLWC